MWIKNAHVDPLGEKLTSSQTKATFVVCADGLHDFKLAAGSSGVDTQMSTMTEISAGK
jgi:hypothetical protein